MQKSKNAFTMLELVFVIVILGILSSIALPKLAATRTDAQISKGRADVSSIRSAIVTQRQARLIKGDSKYISGISMNTTAGLFSGVLTYPIVDSATAGHWTRTGTDSNATAKYDYQVANTTVAFTYTRSNGTFKCARTTTYCKELVD